jgi:hypothetical protein
MRRLGFRIASEIRDDNAACIDVNVAEQMLVHEDAVAFRGFFQPRVFIQVDGAHLGKG